MRKSNLLIFFILIINYFVLSGCVTKEHCVKSNNLSGIIVDENNRPISNYQVICGSNPINKKTTFTNNSGIFVFTDVPIGKNIISGQKNNYGKIENKEFNFDGGSSMLCCQVSSLQELLSQIDRYIINREYEKALNIIEQISVEENHYNSVLVLLYKEYLYIKIKNMDGYIKCINQLRKIKNDKLKEFIKKGDVGL